MRILLVSQYFWPESFKINDLSEELLKRGNEVTVLTGKPNYPQGDYYTGYGFWGYKTEIYKGIRIIRVPLLSRGSGSDLRLSLNYLSFVFFSYWYILTHKQKNDVSLTFAISPITQVYAALLHKILYKSKAYLWVQDLWPESVLAASKMRKGFLYKLIYVMVKRIYRKVDGILVQSEGFYGSIINKGINTNKISYVPNWAEDIFLDKENILINKFKNKLPKGFVIMFAGNIGEAQDFDSIIEAACLTRKNNDIKWVIVGNGRKREYLQKKIVLRKLEQTVFLLGQYPVEDMPNLFIHADVLLVSLKDEEIFSLTIPSKIQCYMAFGKPIVSMLNGVGNKIINEAECGYTSLAGDYKQLALNVEALYGKSSKELDVMGKNGQIYYHKYFSKESIMNKLLNVLKKDI
jgi:glycosyltransferase involved in cell wall biosynthesis